MESVTVLQLGEKNLKVDVGPKDLKKLPCTEFKEIEIFIFVFVTKSYISKTLPLLNLKTISLHIC